MVSVLKLLFANWVVRRLLLRGLGSLALWVPLALILKTIGWPLLTILAVLALPVLLFLFVIGLPVFLVLLVGGALLALVSGVLTAGVALLKVAVVVGLPIALLVWLWSVLFSKPGPGGEPPVATDEGATP